MPANYLLRLAQPDVQDFIIAHEQEDERQFVLTHKEVCGLPAAILAQQLSGRRKSKTKLPTLYATKGVVYPPALNLEQCSSEATALFKLKIAQTLFKNKNPNVAADLTGGFGIDSFFLARGFNTVHYVEPHNALLEIAAHNHQVLGANHIEHYALTAEGFLAQHTVGFDFVFIDPGRRDAASRKVFRLADCVPNVVKLQQKIFSLSRFLLIKTSPLLDIQQGLREITNVKKIFVVSVNNECKELLFLAEVNYTGEADVEAVDLQADGRIRSTFAFTSEAEKKARAFMGEPEDYLYEPNASILKAGAFKLISEKFNLSKLAANTHVYSSKQLNADFPGRIFKIDVLNPTPNDLKKILPNARANVVTRNYPVQAQELKKKLKLKDGGDKFLIGFSSEKKKHLALCSRITNSE